MANTVKIKSAAGVVKLKLVVDPNHSKDGYLEVRGVGIKKMLVSGYFCEDQLQVLAREIIRVYGTGEEEI